MLTDQPMNNSYLLETQVRVALSSPPSPCHPRSGDELGQLPDDTAGAGAGEEVVELANCYGTGAGNSSWLSKL